MTDRSKIIEVMAKGIRKNYQNPDVAVMLEYYPSDIADAERALTALHAEGLAVVQGWQPIESAPSDEAASLMAVATASGSRFLADDTMDGKYARCVQTNTWREGVAFFLLPPTNSPKEESDE